MRPFSRYDASSATTLRNAKFVGSTVTFYDRSIRRQDPSKVSWEEARDIVVERTRTWPGAGDIAERFLRPGRCSVGTTADRSLCARRFLEAPVRLRNFTATGSSSRSPTSWATVCTAHSRNRSVSSTRTRSRRRDGLVFGEAAVQADFELEDDQAGGSILAGRMRNPSRLYGRQSDERSRISLTTSGATGATRPRADRSSGSRRSGSVRRLVDIDGYGRGGLLPHF